MGILFTAYVLVPHIVGKVIENNAGTIMYEIINDKLYEIEIREKN